MDFPWNLFPQIEWRRFLSLISAFWDAEPRVQILGWRHDGTASGDLTVRYKASLATEHVQVHVQSSARATAGPTATMTRTTCRATG